MTMQTTSLGPNSAYIAYTGGETIANVITNVESYITSAGWSVYDAAAGTNQRVYSALNHDGSTHKYVMLDYTYNTNSGVKMVAYESWNASTHTGTNPSANTAIPAGTFDFTNGGYIYIMSNSKWLAFVTKIGTTYGDWFGCFEMSKDLSNDAAPLHAMLGGKGLVGANSVFSNDSSTKGTSMAPAFYAYSPCRNYSGATGSSADGVSNINTIFGSTMQFSTNASNPSSGYQASAQGVTSLGMIMPWSTSPSSSLPWCSTLYATEMKTTTVQTVGGGLFQAMIPCNLVRGRFYGIKILANPAGNMMDTISVQTDSDFFHTSSGTQTTHNIVAYSGSFSRNINFAIPA